MRTGDEDHALRVCHMLIGARVWWSTGVAHRSEQTRLRRGAGGELQAALIRGSLPRVRADHPAPLQAAAAEGALVDGHAHIGLHTSALNGT